MTQFSKEELSFVEEIPKQIEIECPICLNILVNPHLVSCCGHHFCEDCIKRVKASNGTCPMCKERRYQVVLNKDRLRIIYGLQVYCTNKGRGCQWKGELKNLSTHLNNGKREGECQCEKVKCRHRRCEEKDQRRHLKCHEDNECLRRPFTCQYCYTGSTYRFITEEHYKICTWYPVLCPNQCTLTQMPRGSVTDHVNKECPLQPVDCVFSWAGCKERPLRKDIELHTTDTKHMMILAIECGELKKKNEKIKQEMASVHGELKKEIKELKGENEKLKVELEEKDAHIHSLLSASTLLLQMLPIRITVVVGSYPPSSNVIHFYTNKYGHHFSAKLFKQPSGQWYLALAFHHGIYDRFKQQIPQIFARGSGNNIPLIEDAKKLVQCDAYTLEIICPEKIPSDPAVLTREIAPSTAGSNTTYIKLLLK